MEVLNVDNFQLENPGTFSGIQAYTNSKLCNLFTTYKLADRLRGQKVMVNAVDPGNIIHDSDIGDVHETVTLEAVD